MKHTQRFLILLFALALAPIFVACDDDSVTPISMLPDTTYSGLEHLDIEYDGSRMVGKSVRFVQTGNTASLTLFSEIKPSELSEKLSFLPSFPGPGVIPGSPSIVIPIYLNNETDHYSFSGAGETEFVSYNYSGTVNGDKLNFNLSDVKLKSNPMANTVWAPVSFIPTGTSLDAIVNEKFIPFGTDTLSINEMLSSVIRSISFNEDGNAVVTYLKINDGAPQPALCPLTMLQYLPEQGQRMRLYINPTDLVGQIILNNPYHPELPPNPFAQEAQQRSADNGMSDELQQALNVVGSVFAEGIPLEYAVVGNELQVYLDLRTILSPLAQLLPNIPEITPELQEKIMPILAQIDQAKLGFNFHQLQ